MKIVWSGNPPYAGYGPGRIYKVHREKFWGEFFKNRKLWFFKKAVEPISLKLFLLFFYIKLMGSDRRWFTCGA